MVFGKKFKEETLNIKLNSDILPWVSELTHLGCKLQNSNSMSLDMSVKGCQYNSKVNSLLQEFYSSEPGILLKAINCYATSFTGSQLWGLFTRDCERLYKSWNVTIRNVFKVDKRTHRYLLEPVSRVPHMKTMLICRFITFAQKLINNSKFSARFLSNLSLFDKRTVFGQNVAGILSSCNLEEDDFDKLSKSFAKNNVSYWQDEEEDCLWRVPLIDEIIELRSGKKEIDGFSHKEL